MRWFRTFALLLLILFLLLVAAPGFRWFQTRKSFVPTGAPRSDLVYTIAAAPEWVLLPRLVSNVSFDRSGPIGDYLALQQMMAQVEPLRIKGTGFYDLRPYLSTAGMTLSPQAVAMWDSSNGTALLKLPAADLEEARLLVGREFDEWENHQMEIRCSLVEVDRKQSADFLSGPQNLDLEWLTGLPADSYRVIHCVTTVARSGQRAKATSGERYWEEEEKMGNFVELEVDPVLGADDLTVDLNFSYRCHLATEAAPDQPVEFRVITQLTLYAGRAAIFELGTSQNLSPKIPKAYYLVLQVDRLSKLGKRSGHSDSDSSDKE